jgi:Flp pilus assembly protein TadD
MEISLVPQRKFAILAFVAALTLAFAGLVARQFAAAHYSHQADLASLQAATRLEPGNAEYAYRVGRYKFLVNSDPAAALQSYRTAAELNPHNARYWLALAQAYQWLGDSDHQLASLERGIHTNPTTPDVAWEAANLYLVRGETEKAMPELKIAMANDISVLPAALQLAWRATPDADTLLRDVIPPTAQAYVAFLDMLIAHKETAACAVAWDHLVRLQQPVEMSRLFDYFRYLISHHEVAQAQLAWRQATQLAGIPAYLPSADNQIVNPNFDLKVLNGGFDWVYIKQRSVDLALDPAQPYVGHNSLSINFNGQGAGDAGIRQLVPLQPNSTYNFSGYYKAQNLEGAGGVRFAIQDAYDETMYFTSDNFSDAAFWKSVPGTFRTGPELKLAVLRVQRFPEGSPFRGRLWIAGLKLTQAQEPH